MNKSEFIRAYANKMGGTIKDANDSYNAFIDTITDCLQNEDYVHISGFATFCLKDKKARDGINPKSKEKVKIAACKAPVVKFSKTYKDLFNK